MEISNDTPISDTTDNALASNISVKPSNSNDVHEQIVTQNGESIISNHETQSVISLEIVSASGNSDIQQELEISTSPIPAKTISLEEKIITSQDTKSSLSVKGGQGLIQELFTLKPSLQESQIIQNHVSEISETSGSGESNIDEAWQHLTQLCNKAFDAEDKANRANQEEILYWSLYAKDFRLQYNEIIVSSGGKISEKKARSLLYDSINVDTDNAEYQFSSENTEISETGGPRKISSEIETSNIITPSSNSENKIIEEVLRSEDATASKSLPETKTKVSISTESHVSNLSKAE
ncbi:6427_t:CDS:2, partial [Acaulospora morrowiae]